jgi:Flp pilus assembly protein protease CpaA
VISVGILAAAIFFGSLAFISVSASRMLCADVEAAPDGPPTGKPPVIALVGGAAVVGGLIIATGATPEQIVLSALVVFVMVACWCTDMICGILPDVVTLGALALLAVLAFIQRDWQMALSAFFIFVPFAGAAIFTRGLGMGWGDAKLVAITGAALGAPLALVALAGACGAAALGHRIAGWPKSTPIALAPYIAAATSLALPLRFLH